MNTCDKCKHYSPNEERAKHMGDCALMGDFNDLTYGENYIRVIDPTRAYGWDNEGWTAGVYVGEKFGCIHWQAK